MNKVIKLGMLFNEGEAPDFGSIEQNPRYPGEHSLLAADIPKLNSMLTRSACLSYLSNPADLPIMSGSTALVLDEPAVWRYHTGTDRWYEVVKNYD